jgi:hypothetical protein
MFCSVSHPLHSSGHGNHRKPRHQPDDADAPPGLPDADAAIRHPTRLDGLLR